MTVGGALAKQAEIKRLLKFHAKFRDTLANSVSKNNKMQIDFNAMFGMMPEDAIKEIQCSLDILQKLYSNQEEKLNKVEAGDDFI